MCFRHVSTRHGRQAPAHDVAFSVDGTCLLALTKVMNSGALCRRNGSFHGKNQGLVTVPFWVYWTSPYSSHYRPYT